jgi:WD40 repeat protein
LHDLQLDYVRSQYLYKEALELVRGAVHLSSSVIRRDPNLFASQLVGRLLPFRNVYGIQEISAKVVEGARTPWLRPLLPGLHPPGTGLVRTLEGHSSSVSGVAVTPDGKRAVSASSDKTLKVWDLESGQALRTLKGHSGFVNGVAVTPDGKRAVSASSDKTLKVWDLESGQALRTLEGHSSSVNGVAVTPDGKRVISASEDETLKVWDLESGQALRALEGHSRSVNGVAVTPDGKRAVSASSDKTLKVWDLESGVSLASFHCDALPRCCTFVNNDRIVAGDAGGRLHFLVLEQRAEN